MRASKQRRTELRAKMREASAAEGAQSADTAPGRRSELIDFAIGLFGLGGIVTLLLITEWALATHGPLTILAGIVVAPFLIQPRQRQPYQTPNHHLWWLDFVIVALGLGVVVYMVVISPRPGVLPPFAAPVGVLTMWALLANGRMAMATGMIVTLCLPLILILTIWGWCMIVPW